MERNPFTNRHMHSRPLIAIGLVVLAGTSFAAAGGGDLHGDRVLGPLDGLAGSREVYRIHVQPGTDAAAGRSIASTSSQARIGWRSPPAGDGAMRTCT